MRKTRMFSILAIGLLLLQLFGINSSLYVSAKTTDDSNKIELKHIATDKDNLMTWQVNINPSKSENDGFNTEVIFEPGMTHQSIDHSDDVSVKKKGDGYSIDTPEGKEAYDIKIVTKMNDSEKDTFKIRAIANDGNKTYEATDEIEIEREEPVEKETEKPEAESDEKSKTPSKPMTEKVVDKPEDGTDEAPKKERGSEESGDEPELSGEGPQITDEEVGVPSLSRFAPSSNPIARAGKSSGTNWPDPGSLKLDKTATETNKFAEWEVELEVEGKNLKTSSDIVIVFDRSNSMNEGSRAPKAKAAAKEFVNSLLVNEDSTARIALVPFGSETGTVNDPHTQFQNYSGKQTLLNAIDAIQIYSTHASGGTNIHAGLHAADEMLSNSTADQKTIVLMSDGEPTYSIKAGGYDKPYTWPGNRYDFILKDFDYGTRVGSGTAGNKPNYGWHPYSCGSWLFPKTCYDPHVNDHVIPTISEAQKIMNSGIGIYSVGLEVGNVPDAIYTLQNSQNKGYYQGGSDDMSPIFEEIAASIGYAATGAQVTDPLGDMLDLVKDGSYSGEDFTSSHGSVSWDDASETFTWDIGNVKEDEVYTLKYKVTIDCSKNPEANKKYPTNKTTTLNYMSHDGTNASKAFPIPEVSLDSGKITKLGYRVNVDGEPIDHDGNVVLSPNEAEQFYKEVHGEDLAFNENHSVPAGDTPDGYQLHVGEDPTEITITEICNVVEFGYVKTSELPAGKVIAEYVDEAGSTVADSEVFDGHIGEGYETDQKVIPGYEFVKMQDDSADPTGTFTREEQTVIYVYKQLTGTIKLIKEDEDDGSRLEGAIFQILDEDEKEVGTLETDGNGEAVSEPLPIGDYTIIEIEAPYGYMITANQDLSVAVVANEEVKVTVTNKQSKGSIKIIKVDAEDNEVLLEGAQFELQDENGDNIATGTTNSAGEYLFTDVAVGKYQLVETSAPEDYRLLKKPIEVEVTPDNLNVKETIENTKQGWGIPNTGGIGTLGFYGIGLIIMTITGFIFFRRRQV